MKLLASLSIAASVAAASSPAQQVLKQPAGAAETPQRLLDTFSRAYSHLPDAKSAFDSLTVEAKAAWDEVAKAFPNVQALNNLVPPAKPSRRRPDSHWDAIIRGKDLQSLSIEGEDGRQQRKLDGKLEAYTMRSKKVDPGKLGVDPGVKQYSGYLDDDENDKHLFYCEWSFTISCLGYVTLDVGLLLSHRSHYIHEV